MSTSKLQRTLLCLTHCTSHGASHNENTAPTNWQFFILFLMRILLCTKPAYGCWSCWTEGQGNFLKSDNSTMNFVKWICNSWWTSFQSYQKYSYQLYCCCKKHHVDKTSLLQILDIVTKIILQESHLLTRVLRYLVLKYFCMSRWLQGGNILNLLFIWRAFLVDSMIISSCQGGGQGLAFVVSLSFSSSFSFLFMVCQNTNQGNDVCWTKCPIGLLFDLE